MNNSQTAEELQQQYEQICNQNFLRMQQVCKVAHDLVIANQSHTARNGMKIVTHVDLRSFDQDFRDGLVEIANQWKEYYQQKLVKLDKDPGLKNDDEFNESFITTLNTIARDVKILFSQYPEDVIKFDQYIQGLNKPFQKD